MSAEIEFPEDMSLEDLFTPEKAAEIRQQEKERAERRRREADSKVLQVEGGIDAEEVDYLVRLEVARGRGKYFETDQEGRLVIVYVCGEDKIGVSLNDALPRLAGLQHVVEATLNESKVLPPVAPENRLRNETLRCLWGWKLLRFLDIAPNNDSITGQALVELTQENPLEHLEELHVRVDEKSDLVLASVAGCKKLRKINLRECDLTDAGVVKLAALERLEELEFSNTRVTGAGFAGFRSTDSLHRLVLEKCPITDAGLEAIGRLTALKRLFASGPEVTDEGIAHLAGLEQLEELSLSGSQVTAEGLRAISQLPKVETLWISHTNLGDEAIPILIRMKNLKQLYAHRTRITMDGYQKLHDARGHDLDVDVPDDEFTAREP